MNPISHSISARLSFIFVVATVLSLGAAGAFASAQPAVLTTFQSPPPTPPPNDNFADATVLVSLPFTESVDNTYATVEASEPAYCYYPNYTIWYSFTPAQDMWVQLNMAGGQYEAFLAIYRANGPNLWDLSAISCGGWNPSLAFQAQAGVTYYFQAGSIYGPGTLRINVEQGVTPPPVASFGFWPGDPSIFEAVNFNSYSYDPAGVGIQENAWDFGDGATASEWSPTHQYTRDGDYTVNLMVTTSDGRTASTSQVVRVGTHDVAIVRLAAPNAARVGQTRSIVVSVRNARYPERVRVELYKSVPGGFRWLTSTEQNIPVRAGGRTTPVSLSYTFAAEDAQMGKVTFRASASIVDRRDALPADNEAISSATKVSP